MKQFANTWTDKTLGLIAITTLLIGCGGSDNDSPNTNAGENSGNLMDPDITSLINSMNARSLAINSLELVDIALFLGIELPGTVATLAAGDQACAGAGSYSATNAENQIDLSFSDCQLSAAGPAAINGDMKVDIVSGDIADNDYVLDISYGEAFSVANGQRVVSAVGQLGVTASADERLVSTTALSLNDAGGEIMVTMLNYTETAVSADTVSVSIAHKVNVSRFGIEVAVATSADLVGDRAACPASGELMLSATDGSVVSVQGAEGDNVLISLGSNMDTVNCAEIATLAGVAGQTTILVPPAAPGSL